MTNIGPRNSVSWLFFPTVLVMAAGSFFVTAVTHDGCTKVLSFGANVRLIEFSIEFSLAMSLAYLGLFALLLFSSRWKRCAIRTSSLWISLILFGLWRVCSLLADIAHSDRCGFDGDDHYLEYPLLFQIGGSDLFFIPAILLFWLFLFWGNRAINIRDPECRVQK